MAVSRFSGRTAPKHPGGAPNCADWVIEPAYSHEVSSCGYWPGGSEEGSFYAYAYPEPEGFAGWKLEPRELITTRTWGSSFSLMQTSAPRPTRTLRCSALCRARTRRRRIWVAGTDQAWRGSGLPEGRGAAPPQRPTCRKS